VRGFAVSLDEDTSLTFSAAQFAENFVPPDTQQTLQFVKIASLPYFGTLKLGNNPVTENQVIPASQLGALVYIPQRDWAFSDGFDWNGSADGSVYAPAEAPVAINIRPVEDVPTVSDFPKVADLGETVWLSYSDFFGAFEDGDVGDALMKVRITRLPSHGTLTLAGYPVAQDQEITLDALVEPNNLLYTPYPGYNGIDTLRWTGSDGKAYAAQDASVNIVVGTGATAPVLTSFAKTVSEDATLAFTAADFSSHFSDANGDSLYLIEIVQLPNHGKLRLSGADVSLHQTIPAAQLDNLTYQPHLNYFGIDTFKWTASDGQLYAAADATVTITVESAEDPPVLASFSKMLSKDTLLAFKPTDFTDHFVDADLGDVLQRVNIATLPAHGILRFDGAPLTGPTEILASQLDKLAYQPDSGFTGNDSFKWNATDGKGYSPTDATLTLVVNPVQTPPVLTDLSKTLAEDSVLSFTAGDFTGAFADADGDSLQRVRITQLPASGTLRLGGTVVGLSDEIGADQLGNLAYQPSANYNGSDTIRWNAFDGKVYASSDAAILLTITPVEDTPTVSNFTKSVAHDAVLAFAAADFISHFDDPDAGDSLQAVRISQLPTHGTLKLSGSTVVAEQVIPAAELPNLTYHSELQFSGTDSFQWTATDGKAYATTPSTVTIAVSLEQTNSSAAETAALSGFVYLDVNNNGQREAWEVGVPGVLLKLSRRNEQGDYVEVAGRSPVITAADGSYRFEQLASGIYEIRQLAQPACFLDGKETVGSLGGEKDDAGDRIYNIELAANVTGTDYLFGEQGLSPQWISNRLFLASTPAPDQVVRHLNQAPVVDLNGPGESSPGTGYTAAFGAGQRAAVAALQGAGGTPAGASVTDADSTFLVSMTFVLEGRRDGDAETLSAATTGTSLRASYRSGVLTLEGLATPAAYQQVLQSVTYQNTSSSPTPGIRTVTVRAFDGITSSEPAIATITVGNAVSGDSQGGSSGGSGQTNGSSPGSNQPSGADATVVRNGRQVVVTGTQDDDNLTFAESGGQYTVTINGQLHHFSAAEVTSFRFDGNGGNDMAQLSAMAGTPMAQLRPRSATLSGAGYTFEVVNTGDILIDCGANDSQAELFDSSGDDFLIAQGSLAALTGSDFSQTVVGFTKVRASALAGGVDSLSEGVIDYVLEKIGSWVPLV